MGAIRALNMIRALAVLLILSLAAGCGGGGGGGNAGGEDNPPDPASVLTFTYTLNPGQINSLPAEADHVKVVVDGKESIAEVSSRMVVYAESLLSASAQSSSMTLTFSVDPGEHSYTVYALNGTTVVATIGPVTFTKMEDIPPTIPLAFGFNSFVTSQTDVGTDATVPYFGTPDPDRIVQYGGAANDLLSVSMDAGNDWSEQYGGEGDEDMIAVTGTGDDYAYQDGGEGNDSMYVASGDGDDWIYQKGGDGNDTINSQLGGGNDHLYVNGGAGNDTIGANGGTGDDTVTIDGGSGNDTTSYDAGQGTNTASIDGGVGTDALTVNANGMSFTIRDSGGTVFYQTPDAGSTTITVSNVEAITVLDENEMPLFTWVSPHFATSKTDVGTDNPDNLISFGTPDRDHIIQFGGAGNDHLSVDMGAEDDWSEQYGGAGDDTLTYYVGKGTDTAFIDGGDGTDTLNVNNPDDLPFLIQDTDGNVLYQYGTGGITIITVTNVEMWINMLLWPYTKV